jgi:DNA-binding transcriptional MerR regulator
MAEETYLTIGPVAKMLDTPRWKLAYLIERGTVPGPSTVVPGRRLFTVDDVRKIREALAKQRAS